MQVNPYLFYNGKCEEALKYYEKALGAQIEAMMPYGDGPAEMPIPADWMRISDAELERLRDSARLVKLTPSSSQSVSRGTPVLD